MSFYALNLFDLADNDLYRRYSRRSPQAVAKHGGRVVALGRLAHDEPGAFDDDAADDAIAAPGEQGRGGERVVADGWGTAPRAVRASADVVSEGGGAA